MALAEEVFLGHSVTQHKNVSDATAELIDQEVRHLIEAAEAKAREILTEDIDQLHAIAEALLEYETLGAEEVEGLLQGEGVVRDSGAEPSSSSPGKRASVPSSGAVSSSSDELAPKPQTGV